MSQSLSVLHPIIFFQYDNISIRLLYFIHLCMYAHFQSCKRNPQKFSINIQNIDALKIKYITECSPHWTRTYLKKTCFSVNELTINQHFICCFVSILSKRKWQKLFITLISVTRPQQSLEKVMFSVMSGLSVHREGSHVTWPYIGPHCTKPPISTIALDMGPHCIGMPPSPSPRPPGHEHLTV